MKRVNTIILLKLLINIQLSWQYIQAPEIKKSFQSQLFNAPNIDEYAIDVLPNSNIIQTTTIGRTTSDINPAKSVWTTFGDLARETQSVNLGQVLE